MTARKPIVRAGGANRQMPAGDTLLGYARYYESETAPTGTRAEGDVWTKTDTNKTYRWSVDAGGWIAWGLRAGTFQAGQRYFPSDAEPTGVRLAGDIWYDTANQIESVWYVSPNGEGGWVADVTVSAGLMPVINPSDIEVTTSGQGFVAKSPDGSRWRLRPTDAGATSWTKL